MTRQEASEIIEQYRMCSSGDCPTLECADCEYNHDPRKVEEAFLMAIDALESAQPEPCEYAVSAMAVEEMLKDLLPERGMWEIEGDEAKTAICETVHDALDGLWKLPFVKPDSKELSFTQKALDTISRQMAIDALDKDKDVPSKTFTVIDLKTGEEADTYDIALHEDWAKHLMYCDMEGFAVEEDGTLILLDECGRHEYCPIGRFEVRWENDER